MPITKARATANKKYHEKFDDIKVRVPKGQRAVWQEHAGKQGESLNGFIIRAVNEAIAREEKEVPLYE